MGNMLDYVDWRGDLTFEQSPFNEVDNGILSQLSYVNFDRIVPMEGSHAEISLADAAAQYFERYSEEQIRNYGVLLRNSVFLSGKLASTARFGEARLSQFQNLIDLDETKQFAAMQIKLSDGTVFVAYRGTDDTLIGWKENFHMSFQPTIPAQLEAVRYLENTAKHHAFPLRLGGHSKGGNLAVYAATRCDPGIQARIMEVYNNDGPGFTPEFLNSEAYRKMRGRIRTIVPEFSIVGMLLEHEEPQIIVKSNQSLLYQHDAFSWEVTGPRFVRVDQVGKGSLLIEAALKSWLNQLSPPERQQFVDNLFWIFEGAHIRSTDDLTRAKWRSVIQMIRALNQSQEHKIVLARALKMLFQEGRKVIRSARKKQIIK